MDNKLAHRDDLPMELVKELQEKMAELYPGLKVVFAGDAPADQQPDMTEFFKAVEIRAARSFADGTCIDCNALMVNYDPDNDDWKPDEGWGKFTRMGTEEFMGWQCGKCGDADDDGIPRPVNID